MGIISCWSSRQEGKRAEKVRLEKLKMLTAGGCGSQLIGQKADKLTQLAAAGSSGSASWLPLEE